MKKKLLIGLFVIALSSVGYSIVHPRTMVWWFGKLWNAYRMLRMNCQIRDGDFIDKEAGIQFKMPSDTYAGGVWSHSDIPVFRHVDLSWYNGAPLWSEYLIKVYYEKKSGDPREIVSQAMDREAKNALTSENFSNVTIDVKELSEVSNTMKGRLVYSLAWRSPPGERRVDEIRYMLRDGFLVEVHYINAKTIYDKLNTRLLDEMFDSILTSLSPSRS